MDRLYLAGFYTLKFLIFILPSSLQKMLAKFLAFAFMKLKKKRFHIVMTNLDLAFGETKTKEEKLEIAKKCYYNFAKYLGINFILNQNTTKQKILKQVVFKNEHFLLDAMKSGRPIIVTTAHFGQWEIFGLAVAARFGASSVLGRKLDSSVMDKILRANRAQFDVELIDKDGGAKDILKALKAGRIVGILVDQNTAPKDGIKVQFFGKDVLHTPAASVLAQKTNALIINAFIYQKGENLNEICFEEPIDISTFDKEDAVQKATQMQCSACEEMVRARPEE